MERLIRKYIEKLERSALVYRDASILGACDADMIWSREDRHRSILEAIFERLHINAILFAPPAEPYWSIIDYLAKHAGGAIHPRDTETRTFFHALPVVAEFTPDAVAAVLGKSKCAIIPGSGIVTYGTVSPEQAFITYSSVCFSCYVKFFSDYMTDRQTGKINNDQQDVFEKSSAMIRFDQEALPALAHGPYTSEDDVLAAIEDCGRRTVEYGLVDSYFGNISYRYGDKLYISQTGSSLDELRGNIDPCRLDQSSCVGITASSEFSAHREIVRLTNHHAVLHGHPKFSVIMSMDCNRQECVDRDACYKACPHERFIGDIPIVSGEVGTGATGLCNTVPPAIRSRRGVIVYGHGVFTTGKEDFNEALQHLMDIEFLCKKEYFDKIKGF